jgi:hypothetical protein
LIARIIDRREVGVVAAHDLNRNKKSGAPVGPAHLILFAAQFFSPVPELASFGRARHPGRQSRQRSACPSTRGA